MDEGFYLAVCAMSKTESVVPHEPGAPRVLARRVRWKIHWALRPERPLVVRDWWDGMTLVVPHSGSAATAFYRTFPSRAIAGWISEFLRPGMTVVDVGAHIGVYALLAARLAGPRGLVHAIEPQQDCLPALNQNAALNGIVNLTTHHLALGDADGQLGLVVDRRNMGAVTTTATSDPEIMVPALTLDSFALHHDVEAIDLLKLDAAGNELAVLRGGQTLLADGRVERIICKLYNPEVVAARFGDSRSPYEIVEFLNSVGYDVVLPNRPATKEALDDAFRDGDYSAPGLATRSTKGPG